mmetsp:Transcript_129835/g.336708  ORF Transcript_129835/g.336708 Transcript_129835/m.336708 type:complete len:203 (-) Transcript_129835:210-818(-)
MRPRGSRLRRWRRCGRRCPRWRPRMRSWGLRQTSPGRVTPHWRRTTRICSCRPSRPSRATQRCLPTTRSSPCWSTSISSSPSSTPRSGRPCRWSWRTFGLRVCRRRNKKPWWTSMDWSSTLCKRRCRSTARWQSSTPRTPRPYKLRSSSCGPSGQRPSAPWLTPGRRPRGQGRRPEPRWRPTDWRPARRRPRRRRPPRRTTC